MNTRLKQFLAAENITQAQFADNINVVRASVSHILSGRNKPSFDFIHAMMAQYPRLNIEWLMFGKGKMYKDAGNAGNDQLFPEPVQTPEPAADLPLGNEKIEDEVEIFGHTPPQTEIKDLDNKAQTAVKQRKVTKVILMFDDGSYQEL